jgi:NRPS condensation-like uncharacterized protein
MKSTSDFLLDLQKQDIKVWVEGDRLRCNAPKGMLTLELQAELTARKQDLIAYLQQQAQGALQETFSSIRPVSRSQELPLSWTQQRLWFLDRLEGGSNAAYNLSTVLQINGNLNVKVLEQTLAEIIKRHEILRTTFKLVNGTPVQAIDPGLTVRLPVIDLQQYSEVEKAAKVRGLAIEEISRMFDLANGPLMRSSLLQLGSESYILLITMHHIVFDGWSTAIFIKELSTLYQTFAKNLPSPLADLPIQYADFAVWQRQWLNEDILKPKLDYWKQKLAGTPPLLELPTDRPRPPVDSMQGDSETFQLNAEVTEKLKNLSKRSGATLYMILLAALATLLFRYSSQEDIVIGSPIANRYPKETEPLIGLFINTLVLRIDLGEDPSFLELLNRVRQVTLEAYENQNVPFEKLVKELNVKRDLSRNPLFQVWYTLQNTAVEGLELTGLQVRALEFENPTAIFDLEFILEYMSQGIKGRLRYKTDLFEASTIVQMLKSFQTLLQSIVAEPERRLSNLRLLIDEETGGYSINSFPDAELSQNEFEKLMMEIVKFSVRSL